MKIQSGYTNRLVNVINSMREEAKNLREDTMTSIGEWASNERLANELDRWADRMVKAIFNIKDE